MSLLTDSDVVTLVSTLRERGSELDDIEAKSARGGTPSTLWTTISAFANRPGGGVILFGLDPVGYRCTGIHDLDQLQSDLSNIALHQMSPPVSLGMHAAVIDGQTVLGVEVGEVHPAYGPCYYVHQGLYRGAYIRTGDGERPMTEYEVSLKLSSREQPMADREIMTEATEADLDEQQVETLLARVRSRRPALATAYRTRRSLLEALGVLSEDGHPSLSGLLVLGQFPQRFLPNCVITLSAYSGNRPDPEHRLPFDLKCEGPLQTMLDTALTGLQRVLGRNVEISGLAHRETPEYPIAALRELLANAVVHRDYSVYGVRSQIQVRLYSDHLVIENPGGLYGTVSLDRLGDPGVQAARNALLANLAEDLGLMEQRGTGVRVVLGEMRRNNLFPPRWYDGVSFFRVSLSGEQVYGPRTTRWLQTAVPTPLSESQRYGLSFLVREGSMPGTLYRRICGLESGTSRDELQELLEAGLITKESTRLGTVYRLTADARASYEGIDSQSRPSGLAEELLLLLRGAPRAVSAHDLAEMTRRSRPAVLRALQTLLDAGYVVATTESTRNPRRKYRANA